MLLAIKKLLPASVKKPIRKAIKTVKYNYRKIVLKRALSRAKTFKIIVGAAETYQEGWYSTNEQWLDITNGEHWKNMFTGKVCLTHVVAEHVFEHLTYEEAGRALKHIYDHMLSGGRVRVAVPDGYNPDLVYLEHVGIGGIGDDAADHKQLLNVEVLSGLIEAVGFKANHLEGYDAEGALVQVDYSMQDGYVMRSRMHNDAKVKAKWAFPDADTSLIVEGVKS